MKSKLAYKSVSEWNALKCGEKIILELLNGSSIFEFMKRAHIQLEREASSLSFYMCGELQAVMWMLVNSLKTKIILNWGGTQFVPRSKHTPSRL